MIDSAKIRDKDSQCVRDARRLIDKLDRAIVVTADQLEADDKRTKKLEEIRNDAENLYLALVEHRDNTAKTEENAADTADKPRRGRPSKSG